MNKFTIHVSDYDFENFGVKEMNMIESFSNSIESWRLQNNFSYYDGQHNVLYRTKATSYAPNNRLVCNHAKLITDTAVGYVFGNPISYQINKEKKYILDEVLLAVPEKTDFENGLNASIFGVAYELVYVKKGTNDVYVKALDPRNAFIVHDDTIDEKEVLGVYWFVTQDTNFTNRVAHYYVYTDKDIIYFTSKSKQDKTIVERYQHFFGVVPIVQYWNNKAGRGDFELQISLIDAYNVLMSDRINDKEQFVDSILAIYGSILGDTPEESNQQIKAIREEKFIELPEGAKAEYLTQTFDEQGVEVLRKAIEEEIYMQSQIPNFTDVAFAGNTSGVAIAYKLFLLNSLANQKEILYKEGLRKRLFAIMNYKKTLNKIGSDERELYKVIDIVFKRNIPQNLPELTQTVVMLQGMVSNETLIAQLPFIEDVDKERNRLEKEQRDADDKEFGVNAGNNAGSNETVGLNTAKDKETV